MNTLLTLVIVVQVLSALTIIGLVLLQHGKGADMGAAFGSGASGSLFGASGSSNFLSKSTAVAATLFFAATLGLAYIGNARAPASGGVMENLQSAPAIAPQPAAPAGAQQGAQQSAPEGATPPAAAPADAGKAGNANQIPK